MSAMPMMRCSAKGELGQSSGCNAAQGVAILQNTYLATTGQLQRRWATAQAGNTPVLDLKLMRIIRTDRCKRAPMRSMHAPRRLAMTG